MLTDPTPTYDDGLAIGVEADGQIVVAGGAGFDGPNERFVALAYEPDGSLDPTFGGDGKVFTDLTPKADVPFGLAIQDDGKIVVAGGAAAGCARTRSSPSCGTSGTARSIRASRATGP